MREPPALTISEGLCDARLKCRIKFARISQHEFDRDLSKKLTNCVKTTKHFKPSLRTEPRADKERFGFTLIELLLVIGIIGILASMLLSAAFRVYSKAKAMEYDFSGMVYKVEKQLKLFYGKLESYPAIPSEELHKMGVIDKETAKFIRSPYVKFFPFSSADQDEKVVLKLKWSGEYESKLLKKNVTELDDADSDKPGTEQESSAK